MDKRWITGFVALLFVTVATTWYLHTPQHAILAMEKAMRTGEVAAIEGLVDFPAMRGAAKAHTLDMARKEPKFAKFLEENPKKLIEANQLLDAQLQEQITATAISGSLRIAEKNGPARGFPKLSEDWAVKDESWTRFTAVHADPDGQLQLQFERQGLTWRIVGFDIVGIDTARLRDELAETFGEMGG
jgi:hypothetical protein